MNNNTRALVTEGVDPALLGAVLAEVNKTGGKITSAQIAAIIENLLREQEEHKQLEQRRKEEKIALEEDAMGVPVLWIINNDSPSATPPWGKVARITV